MKKDLNQKIKEFMKELSKKADRTELKKVEYDAQTSLAWIKENMLTRDDFMQYMVLFDEMATEVREARREQLLFASRFVDLDDTVHNHEQRISVLENA